MSESMQEWGRSNSTSFTPQPSPLWLLGTGLFATLGFMMVWRRTSRQVDWSLEKQLSMLEETGIELVLLQHVVDGRTGDIEFFRHLRHIASVSHQAAPQDILFV